MDQIEQMISALLNKRYADVMAERQRVLQPGGWREVAGNALATGMSALPSGRLGMPQRPLPWKASPEYTQRQGGVLGAMRREGTQKAENQYLRNQDLIEALEDGRLGPWGAKP